MAGQTFQERRMRLNEQILRASNQEEIIAARKAMWAWAEEFPEDIYIFSGGEQMVMIEGALRERGEWKE